MSLHNATATACITHWSEGRAPAWTDAERERLATRLVAIGDAITPHLVADAALDDAATQDFLLARALAAIDSWLIRAAAGVRRTLPLGVTARTRDARPALGLRSASIAELDAIDEIGRDRATALARTLALHTGLDTITDLDAVDGVGPAVLDRLSAATYLDRPVTALASPSLLAFCEAPTVERYLVLLDRTDLELFHGDAGRLLRHPPAAGTAVARFGRLLELVHDDAERRRSPLAGALASQATRALARDATRRRYLAALTASDGALVVDDGYRSAMLELIAAAGQRVRLAVFVATAPRGDTGPLEIITALEARAAAGVDVRVILDRDRPSDPYHSEQINRPVAERLRAAGVHVKQDERDVLLHSKFLVADDAGVLVGSHNLTTASLARTHEVSVRLDNPALAAAFGARFDALWAALP